LLPRSNTCSPPFLCTPLRCSKRCCPRELSQRSRSTLCLQNRHAGYSFRTLFHNRLDSHLYLGSKGWPATSTSMWLRPPPSGGGVRWIATKLLQRRPCERFCCELLRTSQRCFAQLKARHSASQSTPMYRFYFPPGERDRALADYSSTPACVNLGRYVTHCSEPD
jgi:hypothetical protein